jgi:hypothetical protein
VWHQHWLALQPLSTDTAAAAATAESYTHVAPGIPNSSHDARVGVHTVAMLASSGTPQQHGQSADSTTSAVTVTASAKSTISAIIDVCKRPVVIF